MKRNVARQALLALSLLMLPIAAVASDSAVTLSVDFSLKPASQAGAYQATLLVSDAASGELLSAPQLTFRAGEPAAASTQLPNGDVVKLEVSVGADTSEASYAATLVRGERLLTLQKATVRL